MPKQLTTAVEAETREHTDQRRLALKVLQRVTQTGSFANLILPKELDNAELSGQEAGFVTDAVYGALRWRGLLDAIIATAARRELTKIDTTVLDVLRLGSFQELFMNVPDYAAANSSVELTRQIGRGRLTGFVNAVIRKISTRSRQEWESIVVSRIPKTDSLERLAIRYSHPAWIVYELDRAWVEAGYSHDEAELSTILETDNKAPDVTLIARPGLISREELLQQLPKEATVTEGLWSPYALRIRGVNPAKLAAIRNGLAGVEDEGSQLAALMTAAAPVKPVNNTGKKGITEQKDEHIWLDMCAGPGGKTALLGALATQRGIELVANEPSKHRAELVRHNIKALPADIISTVLTKDGRVLGEEMPGRFDRVLVDAPCSGLGALRRRPEARWVKKETDLAELTEIQRGLLESALQAVRSGGVVAYVTCSPVVAETRDIVDSVLARRTDAERIDAQAVLRSLVAGIPLPPQRSEFGGDVQLFSQLHNTDQMFISLIRKR